MYVADDGDHVDWCFPVTKIEKPDASTRVVFGKATGSDLDLDHQIIDEDFAREGLERWFKSFGNIRQMHSTQMPPAGKAIDLEHRADGEYLRVKVVEPGAIKLVDEGVYSAFSVGVSLPKIVRDPLAKGGRIVGGVFSEVSLVDFPANPTAKFMVVKRATPEDEYRSFLSGVAFTDPDPSRRLNALQLIVHEDEAKIVVKSVEGDLVRYARRAALNDPDPQRRLTAQRLFDQLTAA